MKDIAQMKIALASDHAGYNLKQDVMAFLKEQGAELKDFGCYSTESCDYPDFAHPLAEAIEKGEQPLGIVIFSNTLSGSLEYSSSVITS